MVGTHTESCLTTSPSGLSCSTRGRSKSHSVCPVRRPPDEGVCGIGTAMPSECVPQFSNKARRDDKPLSLTSMNRLATLDSDGHKAGRFKVVGG